MFFGDVNSVMRSVILFVYVSRTSFFRVKVPITSSVYGYTKVLAHNLNSKKTSGAAIG